MLCALVISTITGKCPDFGLPCKSHCIEGWGSRNISESWAWIGWVVENYHSDYDTVYFLHDHTKSWHRPRPPPSTCPSPRGLSSSRMSDKWEFGSERPGLEWFASLLNTTMTEMIATWKLHEHRCCAESCTTMSAIRETPLATWARLKREIEHHRHNPWAWVFERVWPILFRLKL